MAKKVALDKLDIEDKAVSIHDEPPELTMEENGASVRWFASRWFLFTCIAIVVISGVAGFSAWWLLSKKPAPPAPVVAPVAGPSLPQQYKNIEFVNDFLIPLKADTGNQRVLMFDLAFELNAGQESAFRESIAKIRNSVYQTVSNKTAGIPLGPGGMKLLRGEIIADLGNVLDKAVIKTVYFKTFIVL